MLYSKFTLKTMSLALSLTLTLSTLGFLSYGYYGYGTPIERIESPDGAYYLTVYASLNLVAMQRNLFTMPGDSNCDPVWIRLYDQTDTLLNELYTHDCEIADGWITWGEKEVGLPDCCTLWALPTSVAPGLQRYSQYELDQTP